MKAIEVRNFLARLGDWARPKTEQERRTNRIAALIIAFIATAILVATLVYPYLI